MTIEYSMNVDNDVLHAKAWGFDDDVNDVMHYGSALIRMAHEHSCTKALCDERELVYTIATIDIYDSAAFMAKHAPALARVAIVFHPDFLADAKFWENVAINRGLAVSFFKDMDKAKTWLEI